ncbi:hypothetical protein [Kribbella jiaozuonensis]|uniref:Uncharacterized protein n=1 Tax=Kribbella jiaozuonensis TaxID=2575441 RepID=A0A4U3LNK4_9ACTN|nr:hypothetical protein [Kribbella jiaozuonensis]TKK76799.1 hypothetical protein FDA38_31155 [Kribbella jiaozuonensis]
MGESQELLACAWTILGAKEEERVELVGEVNGAVAELFEATKVGHVDRQRAGESIETLDKTLTGLRTAAQRIQLEKGGSV